MTELSIRPDEIRDALQRFVSDYKPETASREEVVTVAETGDGLARVTGLPSAMPNALLAVADGTPGHALHLHRKRVGSGKRVSIRVVIVRACIIKKKKNNQHNLSNQLQYT